MNDPDKNIFIIIDNGNTSIPLLILLVCSK